MGDWADTVNDSVHCCPMLVKLLMRPVLIFDWNYSDCPALCRVKNLPYCYRLIRLCLVSDLVAKLDPSIPSMTDRVLLKSNAKKKTENSRTRIEQSVTIYSGFFISLFIFPPNKDYLSQNFKTVLQRELLSKFKFCLIADYPYLLLVDVQLCCIMRWRREKMYHNVSPSART